MLAMMTLIDDDSLRELFGRLFDKYKQRVFAIAKSFLGSDALAEDSTQETFFYIAKNISKLSRLEPQAREYYILLAAKSFALDTKRRERKYLHSEPIDESFPDDSYLGAFDSVHIKNAVESLEKRDREILFLHYSMGLDYKLTAGTLHITPAAARKRAQYAKARLRQLLEGGNDNG